MCDDDDNDYEAKTQRAMLICALYNEVFKYNRSGL